jgi:integrase
MIETEHVLQALKPIWQSKTETATRVRQRIETILDAAKAEGLRKGDNPARWKGHLSHILPNPSKVRKVRHHPALPYQEVGAFMDDLFQRDNVAAKGLAFLVLTAARTGEVIGATFDEIDTENAVWTIPADRMKARKEHRVPLSQQALGIVKAMKDYKKDKLNKFVFPGLRGGGLSNMALLQQLKHMKRNELTAHGFRSTFRDWAAEQTAYPSDVVEMALAHAIANKTEAAYRRGDLFDKRRRLMNDWADYCEQVAEAGEIVPLRSNQ